MHKKLGITAIRFNFIFTNGVMHKSLHNRIKLLSLIAVIIFIVLTAGGAILSHFSLPEILAVTIMILVLAIFSFTTSYAIVHPEKKWIKKTAKYSLLSYPLLMVPLMIGMITLNSTVLFFILLFIVSILTILSLTYISVFSDAIKLQSTIWIILILIVSIFIKRYHLPFAGFVLTFASLFFGSVNFMYGIRCLYLAEKVPYLRYVALLAGFVVAITFFGLLFKLQHWPGGSLLINTSYVLLLLGTLIVLITLPSSGILDWQPFHKKILRRIILPWVFIFTLFIIRFLSPELNLIIWSSDKKVAEPVGFGMIDYPVENKNGLEPE